MDIEAEETIERIFNEQSPALFWFKEEHDTDSESYKVFEQVARKFKGKLAFVTVTFGGQTATEFVNYFAVEGETILAILPLTQEEITKFKFTQDLTVDNLTAWVGEFLKGDLIEHLKSEEIPEDDGESLIQKVVGKNYVDVVMDPSTHVLVQFYAPWCQHCKEVSLNPSNLILDRANVPTTR